MTAPPPVLVIAAGSGERDGLVEMLERRGHGVTLADQASEARAFVETRAEHPFVILLDLAHQEALRFLRAPLVQRGGIPVICVADRRKPDASSEALRLGIADLVARPVREEDLSAAIANARAFAEIASAPRPELPAAVEIPPGSVFGASPAIREVLALVRRIAPSRCNVLVLGERGTGRESIARAIHAQSSRRESPFILVDCATVRQSGWPPAIVDGPAPGSTIYLNDLLELGDRAHRELMDLLRQRGPVADPRDLRGIAAAPPRVEDAVARGEVPAGLVELLGVVRLLLPPLRQRAEDIPLLATHFLKDACRRNGIPPKSFSRSALTLLTALPWTGNTAELRALADRLAVLIPRGVVLLEDVLPHVRLERAEAQTGPFGTLREARERFERDYVASVLQHHRGRMGDAARQLGIERTNLYRKIKQLNIRWTAGAE